MIIFSGTELVALFVKGSGRSLLVTFIGAYHEKEAVTDFFLKSFVEKNGFCCVGITTHIRGFYLSEEIKEVAKLVNSMASNFDRIMLIGQSMGGYAAVKYSKLFNASHVLAFAPVYSLDPDEFGLGADLERKILARSVVHHCIPYRAEFKRMGIGAADIKGLIVMVYDPDQYTDEFNVKAIKREVIDANLIPVRYLGHTLYSSVASDLKFLTIIGSLEIGNLAMINEVFRLAQRSSPSVMINILSRAARKKPHLCLRALGSERALTDIARPIIESDILNNIVAFHLIALGSLQSAHDRLCLIYKKAFDLPVRVSAGTGESHNHVLLSYLGTFLVYNYTTKTITLDQAPFGKSGLLPVLVRLDGDRATLSVLSPSGEKPISLTPDPAAYLTLIRQGSVVSLQTGHQYVRATPKNNVDTNAHSVGDWERFVLVPLSPESPLVNVTSIGWFERSLINETLAEEQPKAVPRGGKVRSKRWWTSLFPAG